MYYLKTNRRKTHSETRLKPLAVVVLRIVLCADIIFFFHVTKVMTLFEIRNKKITKKEKCRHDTSPFMLISDCMGTPCAPHAVFR